MKHLLVILLCGICIGCADTRVYIGGQIAFRTHADCDSLEFHQGSTSLVMHGVKHSTATLAQGDAASHVIGAVSGLAGTIGASVATHGLLKP